MFTIFILELNPLIFVFTQLYYFRVIHGVLTSELGLGPIVSPK